ncbi:MAG: hypothetical protein ABEJ28_07060 [Salinigranum sp.]
MKIPRGKLLRSRVEPDPATVLETALDRRLTGYAVFEPQDALLLGGETRGVVTFEEGVPVVVYDVASDDGGPDALADLAVPGPYSVELYELDPADLAAAHDADELCVPPGMPAERLGGDRELADRTREAAPSERLEAAEGSANPVEAFLADEEKIAAIREQAREEAQARAEEWGLSGELAGDADGSPRGADGSPDDADR